MDRQYIDDQHIVARYLADQLSESEREAFEAYYLEHPEIVKEMEAVARFKAGLIQLKRTGELERLIKAQPRFPRWQMIAAAAAIGAIVVSTVLYRQRPPYSAPVLAATATMLGTDAGRVVTSRQIMRTRGAARADAEIELPQPAGVIELAILPEYDDPSGRYRVALARVEPAARQDVATLTDLGADSRGFVMVYINSGHIQPGRYELTLAGTSTQSADEISVFSIELGNAGR